MHLSEAAAASFQTLLEEIEYFNGQGIKSAATATPLQAFVKNPHTMAPTSVHIRPEMVNSIVAGDASDRAVCSYAVEGPEFYFRAAIPVPDRAVSSGHRELFTVLYTLQQYGSKLQKLKKKGSTTTVMWLTDSTNLTAFLERGSVKINIQKDILKVFRLAR